jgi:anti-anti-sigma regulatory factor
MQPSLTTSPAAGAVEDRAGSRDLHARERGGELFVLLRDGERLAHIDAIEELSARLNQALSGAWPRIHLDLGGAEHLCAAAVGLLASLHVRVHRRGGRLTISGLARSARVTLAICRLEGLLDLRDGP